jgi:exosortase C (VPDSG-CTERM-specific)
MAKGAETIALRGVGATWRDLSRPQQSRIAAFTGYLVILLLVCIQPLTSLARYASQSDLNSHVLLIPFISGYLLYITKWRRSIPYRPSVAGILIAGAIGTVSLAAGLSFRGTLSLNDDLALMALAFVSFVAAGVFLFFGWIPDAAFPLAFLIFMVPMPDVLVDWLEKGSMLASADAAAMYFDVTGTPVARHGTVFELPGIVIRVAQECSGIRSSWVLFMASVLASHVFLKTRWRKMVLVAFVIPLGILRNGFRILVIGLLCVHIGPHMIDSPIHHRGGSIFFLLSLIPLFLLVWWLRRQEQSARVRS